MSKTVGIIQARLGSTRLPNKMMLSLHGRPIIEWVIRRTLKSKKLDTIIVAIPETVENDILARHIESLGVAIYRGSESDVLDRFYHAAISTQATHIVRICADNPLIDGIEIDRLISFYENNPCDYAYNHIPKNNRYPDGLGAELLSFELLKHMYNVAKTTYYREHCFSYVAENCDRYVIKTFDPPEKLAHPNLKFDIDTFDDYYYLSMKTFDIDTPSQDLIKLFYQEIPV